MSRRDVEHRETLQPDALLGFLRSTGEALARGELVVGDQALPLGELDEYKLSLKADGDRLRVKLKGRVRERGETEAPVDIERENYRQLKRELKQAYKAIHHNLQAGVLPPEELVQRFVTGAEHMAGFPAEAEGLYASLHQVIARLREVIGAGDLSAARSLLQQIDEMRHDAHRQYR